jgi:hypothetical protein
MLFPPQVVRALLEGGMKRVPKQTRLPPSKQTAALNRFDLISVLSWYGNGGCAASLRVAPKVGPVRHSALPILRTAVAVWYLVRRPFGEPSRAAPSSQSWLRLGASRWRVFAGDGYVWLNLANTTHRTRQYDGLLLH